MSSTARSARLKPLREAVYDRICARIERFASAFCSNLDFDDR
jgi:hypothetical protein